MNLSHLTEASLSALSAHVAESLGKTTKSCAVAVDPNLEPLLLNASLSIDRTSSTSTPSSSLIFMRAGATREYRITKQELDWKDDGPVVFVLRPNPKTCKLMASQMTALIRSRRVKPDFKAVFVPRRSFRCEQVLKEAGVLSWFTLGLHAVALGFVPVVDDFQIDGNSFPPDVISLELNDFLRETKVEGDTSSYAFAARALLDLGEIKNMRSKGHAAEEVLKLYLRMHRELNESSNTDVSGKRNDEEGEGDESGSLHSGNSSSNRRANPHDEDEFFDGEEDDENVQLATQVAGPLDVLGGPPRPRRSKKSNPTPGIDTLILIDREIDMVSPLCTPLTYESLLDEHFGGIKAGFLTVKSSVLRLDEPTEDESDQQLSGPAGVTIALRNDPLFKEIRDVSVTSVMSILNEKARELKDVQDRMHRTRDVDDLQEFIQRLPELQQKKKGLATHIALGRRVQALAGDRKFRGTWEAERAAINGDASLLEQRARDSAARGEPLVKVLRLLCLACILGGGFYSRDLDAVRQEIIHAYGYDVMFTLDNLERMGMLSERPFHPQHKLGSSGAVGAVASAVGSTVAGLATGAGGIASTTGCIFLNFGLVKKELRLLVEGDDSSDCAYVFAGYAPISARLVEMEIAPGGWAGRRDLISRLSPNSPTYVDVNIPSKTPAKPPTLPSDTNKAKKQTMVVFFLGGVSLAEIAAIRLIASRPECPYRITIATTSVVNGTTLVQSLFHPDVTVAIDDISSTTGGGTANPFA